MKKYIGKKNTAIVLKKNYGAYNNFPECHQNKRIVNITIHHLKN